MVKKYDFIDRVLFLIRKKLEEDLPKEATLDEMIQKYEKLIKEIL